MIVSMITAMDQNRLIGKDNALPWKIPADLQFFKKVTMSKPIIMGRKTFESIGRPLPGRQNIIITRDHDYRAEGCDIAYSTEQALKLAENAEEVMIIGGANIYQQFLERCDRLYITKVKAAFEGDAWFPEFDESQWLETEKEDHLADEKNEADYSFVVLNKKSI